MRSGTGSPKPFIECQLPGDLHSSQKELSVHGPNFNSSIIVTVTQLLRRYFRACEGWNEEKVDEEIKMFETKKDELLHDHNHDGVDRRGFLKCMAWAGTGAFCVIQGGVLKSYSLSKMSEMGSKATGELSFVQISDSDMGFNKPANTDVIGTLKAAIDKVNGLSTPPEFMLHTGDISHLSKPEEFDTVDQILKLSLIHI